jgi:XTP/dITP diphosphohydrolase
MRLLVATRNRHKLEEMIGILEIPGLKLVSLLDMENPPEIVENGRSFQENALIKARAVAQRFSAWTMADDSGIEVDALNGEPGIYSARFGGENLSDGDRNAFLLKRLKGVPLERRTARFKCVMALVSTSTKEFIAEGRCEGRIALEVRGESGFGYDPVFLLQDGRTMAELSPEEKNRISHRYRALQAIRPTIVELLEGKIK